jgi:ABC-type molybdate transport system ATPase subunit
MPYLLEVNVNRERIVNSMIGREKKAYHISYDNGHAGAGKTETAKILIGAVRYNHGEIFINRKWAKVQSIFDSICSLGPITVDRRKDEPSYVLRHQDVHHHDNLGLCCKLVVPCIRKEG